MAGAATDLMAEASRWTRRVVDASPCPDWATLERHTRPWLLLDGAFSDTLDSDDLQIKRGFEYRWVWRDTPREHRVIERHIPGKQRLADAEARFSALAAQ